MKQDTVRILMPYFALMNFRLIPALFVLCFASCYSTKKVTVTRPVSLDNITVSANNNPLSIYRESAPHTWDIINNRVALSFNLKDKTAEGHAWIRLEPYCCTQDSIVLDAKSMHIDTVRWIAPDAAASAQPFTYHDDQLVIKKHVDVAAEVIPDYHMKPPPGELYIHYIAQPYADSNGGGSEAISEARGLYFINTDGAIPGKPAQIWTQGETESNSHWMPTIDKPNERFTTQIELTVPDSFGTLSNGELTESKKAGAGMRRDVWKMNNPIQAYAVMFAIGRFSLIKETWRDKEVAYYTEPEYAPYAKLMFRHTPEMMEYFSKITGVPFPWNKYSQIVVRDYVSGAMENTSASLFGEFMNQDRREIEDNNFEDVVAHELFHQWFGDYVTMESWSNLTLSESFANYSEQLWRAHQYGAAYADELGLEDLNKYIQSTEKGNDPELVRYSYGDREEMFDRISYNKGGAILHYIHSLVGDTSFYRAMHIYLTKNAGQSTEASDWRKAIEAATGQDWTPFFNQWYYRGGHPELGVKYTYDDAAGKLIVIVRQRSSPDSSVLYRLPLKTAIVRGKQLELVDWIIKSRSQTFIYSYANGERPLIIPDYEHWLPGVIREQKDAAQWLAQFEMTTDYINKYNALSYAQQHLREAPAQKIFMLALNDPITGIKGYALSQLSTLDDEQKDYTRQVQYLATMDGSAKVRAAAFNVLNNWKISSSRADMEAAVSSSSYLVAGAALRGLQTLDKEAGYQRAKALLLTGPKSSLEEAVWEIIAEHGAADDLPVYTKKADKVYGLRRVYLAGYLGTYLAHVKEQTVFDSALVLLDKLYRAENISGYREQIFASILADGDSYSDAFKASKTNTEKDIIRRRITALKATLSGWINGMKEQELKRDLMNKAFRL